MLSLRRALLASALVLSTAFPAAHAADLIVGFTLDADTLDPANHRKRETETIIRNMYDGLVTRDGDMKVVPEIAESFVQVSPTVYEFKIRSGIKFVGNSQSRFDYLESQLPGRSWGIADAANLMRTHADSAPLAAPLCQHQEGDASETLSSSIYSCRLRTLTFSEGRP